MNSRAALSFVLLVACAGLASNCGGQAGGHSGDVTWSGIWFSTQDPTRFGTFVLEFRLSGENMDVYGGNGSASGTLSWKDAQGDVLFEDPIDGQWENESEQGQVGFSLDVAVPERSFSLSCIYWVSAASIDGDEEASGSFSYGDDGGSWQVISLDSGVELAGVLDASTVDTDVHVHDLTWANAYLYATGYENPDQVIIRIDPQSGQTERVQVDVPNPKGITFHDSFFWVLSAEGDEPEEVAMLYKYSDGWTLEGGYPIELSLDSQWGMIPTEIAWWDDGIISFSSGTVQDSGIQKIDPQTGQGTVLIPSGIPRAMGLAATQSQIWTGFSAIGGEMCTLDERDAAGQVVESFITPGFGIGPIASESDDIWMLVNGSGFLYKISGSP